MAVASPIDDLRTIFDLVARALPAAGVECLLVGGFAVNHHGYTRNTLDVDFMIVAEQQEAVRTVMRGEGFTNVAVHGTVMFLQRPGSPWRVDFLHADRDTMAELFSRAEVTTVHGSQVKVPALKDLIAMKLFSLAQNPERRMGKDLPDIAQLAVLNGLDLERDLRPLANRYATEAVFELVSSHVRALQI
jgi:hypothetical protein